MDPDLNGHRNTSIDRSGDIFVNMSESVKRLIRQMYVDCIVANRNVSDENETETVYCPASFDAYTCWPRTVAGKTISQPCPSFVTGFDGKRLAYKTCLVNGSWFAHPSSGKEWSNYTTCVDTDDLAFRRLNNTLYIVGYLISLVTLVMSLIIFLTFRSLRCTRIKIHIQLFISLALSCIAWIAWYRLIVKQPHIFIENPVWCIVLHVGLQYLMLSNYFWMFCEGLHLHLVLVVVFVKDAVAMKWFLGVGWILPSIFVGSYTVVRLYHIPDTDQCWSSDSDAMWTLNVPVIMSLVASMIFLINVVRVLLTKLHPSSSQPAQLAVQKAARATLILVPLFGLQHILIPFRPDFGSTLEKYYQIVAAVFISLQGLCVSCLFCFINQDVLHVIRSVFNRFFLSVSATGHGESFNAPVATQSRDVVV